MLTYTIGVSDGDAAASQAVTVTITGTNDAPTIASATATGSVTEQVGGVPDEGNANVTSTGSIVFADLDTSDVHSASVSETVKDGSGTVVSAPLGGLTLGGVDQAGNSIGWTFTAAAGALEFLAAGESRTQVYEVVVDDGKGGQATQAITITITGTNDAPILTVDTSGGVTEDGAIDDPGTPIDESLTLSDSGAVSFADIDGIDTHVVTASYNDDATWKAGADSVGTLTGEQIDALRAGFSVNASSWNYSVANSALQFLAAGESVTLSFDVTVADESTGEPLSDSRTVTLTLTGTNDAPVISVGAGDSVAAALTESNTAIQATGQLTTTDADVNDTVIASVQNVAMAGSFAGTNPLSTEAMMAMLSVTSGSIPAQSGDTGNLAWSFNSGAASSFDFLPAGQTVALTYTLQVTDPKDPSFNDTQEVTVTVTGTDDKPVVDISGSGGPGLDGEVVFKPRGGGVALFAEDLVVGDPDDAELLTGATVVLDPATTLDNAFGTLYETIYAQSSSAARCPEHDHRRDDRVVPVGQRHRGIPAHAVRSGDRGGVQSRPADAALPNTNPNAFAGSRDVTVTVRDDGVATGGGDKLLSDPAHLTVNVNWTPVVDLNGSQTGRNFTTTYVEKQSSVTYVASSTATIFDQNGLIKSVTLKLQDAPDGAVEKLWLSPATLATLQSFGIKAQVIAENGMDHSVVLSAWDFTNDVPFAAGRSTSSFQIGLRGVAYTNSSASPNEVTERKVLISTLDVDGTAGVSATTTINVTGVNIPPELADPAGNGTVVETSESTLFTGANLAGTLTATDEDLQQLTFGIALPQGSAYSAVDKLAAAVEIAGVSYDIGFAGLYGTLYVNSATGAYTYVPDPDLVDGLDGGESATESFHLSVTDGQAGLIVKPYSVALTGANDAPTLSAVAAGITEIVLAGTTTDVALSGTLPGADVDDGAVLSFGIDGGTVDMTGDDVPTGTVSRSTVWGALTVNTTTGQYSFAKNAAAIEALAEGQVAEQTFTIEVSDGVAGMVTSTLTVTMTGGNDAGGPAGDRGGGRRR